MPTQSQALGPLPERLTVVAWLDGVAAGPRRDSPYVEAALGVLGPSTTLAWRRLARIAAARPGASVVTAELAQSLGLSQRLDDYGPMPRAVARMVAFRGAARNRGALAVRSARSPTSPSASTSCCRLPPSSPTSSGATRPSLAQWPQSPST